MPEANIARKCCRKLSQRIKMKVSSVKLKPNVPFENDKDKLEF
jgi:hypothetical protein